MEQLHVLHGCCRGGDVAGTAAPLQTPNPQEHLSGDPCQQRSLIA